MVESSREKKISIIVRNKRYEVPGRITVKKALKLLGYEIFSPCEVGGCGRCVVKINHAIKPSLHNTNRKKYAYRHGAASRLYTKKNSVRV